MWLFALQVVSLIGALCSIVYSVIAFWCVNTFRSANPRSKPKKSGDPYAPAVSILKPLCGKDRFAYECIASQFVQDYPSFEIIFGVSDPNDLVVPVVHEVMQEAPEVQAKLIFCSERLGANRKISNLIQMLKHARNDVIVINDSDILTPRDYLLHVAAALDDSSVGMVTCLYSGIAGDNLGSRLEALGITSDFVPGVLCARFIEGGLRFALGSTLAFPRRTLDAIGGLESLADYLADDYQMGYRASLTGRRVELAACIVEHALPDYSFKAFLQHQLRWARAVRASRPAGYAGLIFTFAIPWSLLVLIAARGSLLAWTLLGCAIGLRYAIAFVTQRYVLLDRIGTANLWLLPIHDLVAPLVWIGSYMGRRIVWRGNKFELVNGKLRPV